MRPHGSDLRSTPGMDMFWSVLDVASFIEAVSTGTETLTLSTVFERKSCTSGQERVTCSREHKTQHRKFWTGFSTSHRRPSQSLPNRPDKSDPGSLIRSRRPIGFQTRVSLHATSVTHRSATQMSNITVEPVATVSAMTVLPKRVKYHIKAGLILFESVTTVSIEEANS